MLSESQIAAIAQGDQQALRALHGELYRPLFFYAHTLSGDVAASEDAVQEAFVKYWSSRQTFDNAMAVKVYLYLCVRNLMRNHVRNAATRSRIVSNMDSAPIEPDDLPMVAAETCALVRSAVQALAPQTRRVIELSMAELTVGEIAQVMQISPNTVKTLKKVGYQSLRGKLKGLQSLLPIILG